MNKFRAEFDFKKFSKEINRWFPGHMATSLKKMYEHLNDVDGIIEVHDARVSFLKWVFFYHSFY